MFPDDSPATAGLVLLAAGLAGLLVIATFLD